MVVANPYSQQTIQNQMQPPQMYPTGGAPGGTNQFQVPQQPNNMTPPDFYPIGGGRPGGGGSGQPGQPDPRYNDQFNPNFSGPIFNPYAPPTPYGMNKVSPTGQVQGIPPAPAVGARVAQSGGNGSGPSGGKGDSNDGSGRNNSDGGGGGGNKGDGGSGAGGNKGDGKDGKGGGFFKGFYDITPKGKKESAADKKAEGFLRGDPALQDTLRNLLASRGEYQDQYNMNMGNIMDKFLTNRNYLRSERGDALNDMTGAQASSGMIRSSGAAGDMAGIERDFQNQIDLARQEKTEGKTSAITERQNFMRQLELAKLQARSDALRRFAAEQMDVGGLLG